MTAKTKPDAADTAAKPEIPTRPLLSELAGMSTARAWGERLSRDIADYRAGTIKWSDVDPGCVLHGPPGTGKTTFATARRGPRPRPWPQLPRVRASRPQAAGRLAI